MSWRAYGVTSFRICQAVGGGTLRNSALRQSGWSPLVSMCSTDGVTFTDGRGGHNAPLDHSYVQNPSSC